MKFHPKSNNGVFSKKQRRASRHLSAIDRELARTNTARERQQQAFNDAAAKAKLERKSSDAKPRAAGGMRKMLSAIMRRSS